jgi:ABC-type multidrug transport system ATPase subunit
VTQSTGKPPADGILIGSAAGCDLRLNHPDVASQHARANRKKDGRIFVQDMGSEKGIALNRPENRLQITFIGPSDTIFLGKCPLQCKQIIDAFSPPLPHIEPAKPPLVSQSAPGGLPASHPQQSPADIGLEPGSVAPLDIDVGVAVIGRAPDADIQIPHPTVSLQHAVIVRTESDEYYIRDLHSTYGTFLDGQRIGTRRLRILPGQVIGIAGHRFSLGQRGEFSAITYEGVAVFAKGVSAEVGGWLKKRINLEDVTLAVFPGKLVSLMGPSGAGKTTLLRILAGQSRPHQGAVFYNEDNLYDHYNEIRALLGYVPQEDIMHAQLTVRQALRFSARLRLPSDFSNIDIERRIDQILGKLGIAGQADIRIGSAEKRGISGGQRKRVNIAMELLADPTVLLLDEPTSGLSSSDTERVVRTLDQLASEGRTLILTIHQPPPHVFKMFDFLAVVDNHTVRLTPPPPPEPGRLIYYGPAAEGSPFFQANDTSGESARLQGGDAVLEAIEKNPGRTTREWQQIFEKTPTYRRHIGWPLGNHARSTRGSGNPRSLPSDFRQLRALTERLATVKRSDLTASIWLALQPVIVAMLIYLVSKWLQTQEVYPGATYLSIFSKIGKALLLSVISAIWFGCNNTVREVVGELAIYRRERMFGLSLSAYLCLRLPSTE